MLRRRERLHAYRNYVNCPDIPHTALACEVAPLSSDAHLYSFAANARAPKAAIVHFQLRHLVHATSSADVFFSGSAQHGVCHWNAVTRKQRLVLPVDHDVQVSTCGRMAVVVGDNMRCALMDITSGTQIAALAGHLDFSFAAAWHPSGSHFATGSQDATARIWDVRRLATSRRVLQGKLGAIRSLRYSADGTALAALEPADFVHVYDCGADYRREQLIDLFGENAGVSFSPCGEVLFVGVSDLTYGSLVEYHRVQPARRRLPRL